MEVTRDVEANRYVVTDQSGGNSVKSIFRSTPADRERSCIAP